VPSSRERIGFVGLGQMGSRMAARLVTAGFDVAVHDIDTSAVAALVQTGASEMDSPRALADNCKVVLCSLPRPEIAERVMVGPGGLAEGKEVKLVIDLSTTGSAATARIASVLAAEEIALVDAPVSGGVRAAEAGTLTMMIAGDEAARAKAEPFLACLGNNRFIIGDEPGLGQKMKLVNNMLCAANAVTTFEALVCGVKQGLDAETMLNVINVSSGRSFISTDKVPQCVLPRTFPPRFATELLLKDLKLGVDEARASEAPLWMMHAALEFISSAMDECGASADYANLIKYFERRANVEVVSNAGEAS